MANYLYNGTEHPALPQWDRSAYPYAMLCGDATFYQLWVSDQPFRVHLVSTIVFVDFHAGTTFNHYYREASWSEEWVIGGEFTTAESDRSSFADSPLIWANFELLNSDGSSVILSPSNPMDAETGEEIHMMVSTETEPEPIAISAVDPLSMLLGWRVGNAVRNMRDAPKHGEPVAYRYNDVELPPIPNYDTVKYPYVLLVHDPQSEPGEYYMYGFGANAYYLDMTNTLTGGLYFGGTPNNSYTDPDDVAYIFKAYSKSYLGEYRWYTVSYGTNHSCGPLDEPGYLIWSNFDVEYNGVLYMKASEPVPVYK